MTSTTSGAAPGARAQAAVHADDRAWLAFASIMLAIAGVLNVVYGIGAIDRSKFFVTDAEYVISDLRTWGWVVLVLGALQVLAAFSIWGGGQYGRWFGIACASANAIAQLLAIPGYPFLAITLFGVNVLIIYGLAVHGGHGNLREEYR
jgi:hypothetical protein